MPFWSRHRVRTAAPAPQPLFDALEDRLALYSDPFLAGLPALSLLANNQNTVIRMQTNQGFIDIELFDVGGPGTANPAPITTANFLNYIRTGRFDNTFFHRLVATPMPFVLQGGGFSLKDPLPGITPKFDAVVEDAPIVNEFVSGRSNVERTIAMAQRGGNANSATSQFFFNLTDNNTTTGGHTNLDAQNFVVFGKVIQGWDTVTTIQNLQVRDLDFFLTGSNPPGAGLFDQVPLKGPADTDVVTILEIDVIKPKNQTSFYTFAAYYPEGYRSGRSSDTIGIVNSDPNAGGVYQVIARFENGQRDRVVAQGFITAGAHIDLPVYRAQDASLALVRGGAPLGYEIRSSTALGASINHFDFGATAGESFINAGAYTAEQLQSWSFANGQKGAGLASFLTWLNLSDQSNNVSVLFYPEAGAPFGISKTVQPYRRGGLDVNQLALVPGGLYSVIIASSHPIVASLSQYRFAPQRASTETGVIAGGLGTGVLPGALIPSNGQSTISAVYTGAAAGPFAIDLDFILSDGTVLTSPGAMSVSSSVRRRDVDVSTINASVPHGQFFTIRYRVTGTSAVSLAYTSVASGDTVTTPFQTASTERVHFGDGFISTDNVPTPGNETISIYNPFLGAGVGYTYRLKFHFVTGGPDEVIIPASGQGSLQPGERVDITVRDLAEVMARIASDPQNRHYSITVETTAVLSGSPVRGAVFAQLTRLDPAGNTITTGPSLAADLSAIFITDPRFS